MRCTALPAGMLLLALSGSAGAQDADRDEGQLLFNNACRTCHTLREGDNRLGPNLHGIVGRKAGRCPTTTTIRAP